MSTVQPPPPAAPESAPHDGRADPALILRGVTGRSALGSLGSTHPFNFELRPGEVGVMFGGKETSSLFRMIMGTGAVERGEIHACGMRRSKATGDRGLSQWRQAIGFGFREKGLISNLTLKENVDLPAKYHGWYKKGDKPGILAERALDDLGVEASQWNVRPTRISWDVRKKVLLARAIVLSPRVLILDDPSALLPSPSLPELLRWIERQQAKGTAILCGTNDYPVGVAIASWVLHPVANVPTMEYRSFIDEEWIQCASLLLKQAHAGNGGRAG